MAVLEFRPEPLDRLQSRFDQAVQGHHQLQALVNLPIPPPAEVRRHYFDFSDGLRLIVCRGPIYEGAAPCLQFAACVVAGYAFSGELEHVARRVGHHAAQRLFLAESERRFRKLSGEDPTTSPWRICRYLDGGLPNWGRLSDAVPLVKEASALAG